VADPVYETGSLPEGLHELEMEPSPALVVPPPVNVPVAQLEHGLRDVVFHEGTHPLREFGSAHFNYPRYLQHIHQPHEIDYAAIPPFVTTSRDDVLHQLALEYRCRFKGSTSSMTSVLSQFYFNFSNFKPVNLTSLSPMYHEKPGHFTPAASKPVSVLLRPRDGVYSIDSDTGVSRGQPRNQILLDLGKSMERMLTMTESDFAERLLLRNNPDGQYAATPEAYHYTKRDAFLLRSQLDCYDPDLPGPRKTFDLKTRATSAIRLDCSNYMYRTDYRITRLTGFNFSYEREFYDMIRSAFLKYSLQVRMGNMHGAFVAYHNTAEIFGFEYLPLEEMDHYIFGGSAMADKAYDVTCKLFSHVLERVTDDHPNDTLKLCFAATRNSRDLDIWVEVLPDGYDQGWVDKSTPGLYVPPDEPVGPVDFNRPLGRREPRASAAEVEQLIPVVGRVFRYTLSVHTVLNGKRHSTPFAYEDGDDLQVHYRLREEPTADAQSQATAEYRDVLRRAYAI